MTQLQTSLGQKKGRRYFRLSGEDVHIEAYARKMCKLTVRPSWRWLMSRLPRPWRKCIVRDLSTEGLCLCSSCFARYRSYDEVKVKLILPRYTTSAGPVNQPENYGLDGRRPFLKIHASGIILKLNKEKDSVARLILLFDNKKEKVVLKDFLSLRFQKKVIM